MSMKNGKTNLKLAVLVVVCLGAGVSLAALQAMFFGVTAPAPGALMPDRFVLVDDGSRQWVLVESSGFGIRQYDTTPDPPQLFLDNQPVEEGVVPGWVMLPGPDRSSISRGFGWPLVALTGTEVYEGRRMVETPGYAVGWRGRMTPTQIRPGLIVNGLVFGFVLLGAVLGIGRVWGAMRGRRVLAGAG